MVISGFLFGTVTFWLASALMILMPPTNTVFQIMMWVVSAVTAYFLAKYFYVAKKEKNNYVEGISLGVAMIVVSALMEVVTMVYGFAADVGWLWFMDPYLWAGYLLVIVSSVIALKK